MESNWLIKAGGRIMGPYTVAQVLKAIEQREFLALDEAAQSLSRWKYLRDIPVFDAALMSARKSGSTTDELTSTNTQTSTETITELLGEFGSIDQLRKGFDEQLKKPKVEVIVEEKPPGPITNVAYYEPMRETKAPSSLTIPRWGWMAVLVLAVGTSWMFFAKNSNKGSVEVEGPDEYRTLLKAGLEAKEVGDYRTAIRLLQKAEKMNSDNLEVVLNLTPLLVMDHETVIARRILDKHVGKEKGPSFQKRAQNILALTSLAGFDVAKAETHLDESLNSDALYIPAIVNRGIVHSLRKEFEKARVKFNQADSLGSTDGLLPLSKFKNAVDWYQDKGGLSEIEDSLKLLKKHITNQMDYRVQAKVAIAYGEFLTKKPDSAALVLSSILSDDPDMTTLTVLDPMFYRENLNWGHVYGWFEKFYPQLKSDPRLVAVNGYLVFKSKSQKDGKRIIEDALLQSPNDPDIRTLLAYTQFSLGTPDEAEANLRMISLSSENPVTNLLRARYCEMQSNHVCALDAWEKLLRLDPQSPQALAGLAWAAHRNKDLEQAKSKLSEGIRIAPNYIPLKKLSYEVFGSSVGIEQ